MGAFTPLLAIGTAGGAPIYAAGSLGAALGTGAAIGGMSLLSTLSTGLGVASTLFQGQAQKEQYEAQARTEKFNAQSREIERKKNLIRSLALSNVRMGAAGIGTGGSQLNLAMQDIHAAEQDQFQADVGTRVKIDTATANARNATTFSLLSAGADVGTSLLRAKRRGSV